ncbi:hypothetical protein ACFQ1L_13215 [Phytohabitans flavus]|uniref:hypothetical protein n=1 Tax=Phytohabitans flavus TaxID=1076124 RepID=UPI00363BB6FD
MTAQPGERMLSWLDEDDPNRGTEPYVPVESVIELTLSDGEPPPKKSRREKAPKPQKPPREKWWRREKAPKATEEKPPREDPPRDVTPRAEDWPPRASEDWLTKLRGQATRQEWAESRDTKPRDAGPDREWTAVPDEAPRNTGPHPAWAGAPEEPRDDERWTAAPPLRTPPPTAQAGRATREEAAREDWFVPPSDGPQSGAPSGGPQSGDADRAEWSEPAPRGEWTSALEADWDPPREAAARADWDAAPPSDQPRWNATGPEQPDPRDGWDRTPEQADRRDGWERGPEQNDRRDLGREQAIDWERGPVQDERREGWDRSPEQDDRRNGWNGGTEQDERRFGRGGGAERKARPDWVASPVPAGRRRRRTAAGRTPSRVKTRSPRPAPLDITPDDDLDEPPAKRRRGPRPSGPPTGDGQAGVTAGAGRSAGARS